MCKKLKKKEFIEKKKRPSVVAFKSTTYLFKKKHR